MAKTKYEITYIIKPDIDEDSKKALIERFDKVVSNINNYSLFLIISRTI